MGSISQPRFFAGEHVETGLFLFGGLPMAFKMLSHKAIVNSKRRGWMEKKKSRTANLLIWPRSVERFSPRRAHTLGDKPKKRQARMRWQQVNIAGQGGS
ncbi:hypothetical protein TNCV_4885771 [Trichonephila clavipes]|uniref:Uncharacterized protein n=1 Tax=Trichonephila clavipes TaxID=2585209 RepID=A0A8X6RI21_TRICX|nr:hypothetical protein TNCV_4885771 [Trichonephila clavipes]